MKVGIITFHRAINYGAILQAYALKKKIDELGNVTKVIDYVNLKEEKACKIINTNSLKSFIGSLLKFRFKKRKDIKFVDFRKKYLNLTPVVGTKGALKELNAQFNVFITGSDQVWNYNIIGGDMTYLLDFANEGKKNSYAASFGVINIEEKYKRQYSDLLNSFTNIAVREDAGAKIIRELCHKEVPVVLDPTLLLDAFEWMRLTVVDRFS